MTDEELLALHAKTTPGEWVQPHQAVSMVESRGDCLSRTVAACHGNTGNAAFIAAAHNELPRLIAEKRALEDDNEALENDKYGPRAADKQRIAALEARIRNLTEPQPETTAPRDGTRILGKRWALNYYESVSFSAGEFRDRFGERVVIDGWIPSPEVTP